MKVTFFVLLFLLIISRDQAISNEDEGKSPIHSNEQANELNGNLYGNGNREVSTSLNNKNVTVTIRASSGGGKGGGGSGGGGRGGGFGGVGGGGGGRGGGGNGGGGKGGGGAGGMADGIIGAGIIGHHGHANDGHNHRSHNSARTLSAWPHFCVSTLILCVSFWL